MIKENNLSPKSIAIVGVSQDSNKIGSVILKNLLDEGFNGKVYPINPKYKEVQGKECYPDLNSVKDSIDMVCIAVPSQFVSTVVDDCIEKK